VHADLLQLKNNTQAAVAKNLDLTSRIEANSLEYRILSTKTAMHEEYMQRTVDSLNKAMYEPAKRSACAQSLAETICGWSVKPSRTTCSDD